MRRAMPPLVASLLAASVLGCGDGDRSDASAGGASRRLADVEVQAGTLETSSDQPGRPVRDADARGLARAAGGADGRRYLVRAAAVPGTILGVVTGGSPRDTSIVPTHDLTVCRPFTEAAVPSTQGGVGNTVVWLEGVAEGPKDDAPRRVTLTLDGCRITPRVQRVAAGGTVMVNSRDAMMSRLQFIAAGESTSRATIMLSDAGQVVPTSDATMPAGLVEVRDDRHPWVRAWIAATPHPFVAVTGADGQFRFDNVPPGKYTLVAWQERMGVRRIAVRVDAGVQARVELGY